MLCGGRCCRIALGPLLLRLRPRKRLRRPLLRLRSAARPPSRGHSPQLTYEGLLDEVFGLACGQLRAPDGAAAAAAGDGGGAAAGGAAAAAGAAGGKKVYGLNSGDAVFRETRDKFYVGARKWLNDTLRWVGGQGGRSQPPLLLWLGSDHSMTTACPCVPPSPGLHVQPRSLLLLALSRRRTIQQFRDQGMHTADINALRGFVAGAQCGVQGHASGVSEGSAPCACLHSVAACGAMQGGTRAAGCRRGARIALPLPHLPACTRPAKLKEKCIPLQPARPLSLPLPAPGPQS